MANTFANAVFFWLIEAVSEMLTIIVLHPDHEFNVGDAVIPVRCVEATPAGTRWVQRPALLVDRAEDGTLTAVPIAHEEIVPAPANEPAIVPPGTIVLPGQ